jgi:anion-transporting  ArsA/GET3 family ATPase
MDAPAARAALAAVSLVVVTGKGGVGKSVVSAALGQALHRAGRRVLLLETDPRENLHELAGVAPSGGDLVAIGPGFFLQNLSPQHVIGEIVREHLHVEYLVRKVSASPVFRHFVDAAPGIKELAVLGHALRLVRGYDRDRAGLIDTVVLDAPASGHGLALLRAPAATAAVIDTGPFARMARELAVFVRDPAASATVVVTSAEEMPVQEALELRAGLRSALDREPDLLVVNALYPPVGRPAGRATDPLWQLWQRRRRINERELARLDAEWPAPRLELPLLPLARGPALVEALTAAFDTVAGVRLGRPLAPESGAPVGGRS